MNSSPALHRVSIVIPVYQGEKTLPVLLQELQKLTQEQRTKDGNIFRIAEVVLVHDCGPDDSAKTIATLAKEMNFVKPVWLSRNYGQHPATLAGMASATGEWVVTMDEDGQQNPADIAAMLDTALRTRSQLVYARPLNPAPHGMFRNALSWGAKKTATVLLGNKSIRFFNSFRLLDGEIARSLAAYSGSGVFLDVALFWITASAVQCPVTLRREMDRPSGYSLIKLISHFWQLLLTSGTRPLRLITMMGFASLLLAIAIMVEALWLKFHLEIPVQGWASIVIVVSFFSGCILMSLGIIAEYLAVTMTIVMGKPLYLVTGKPGPSKKKI
jgi:undecaprenyl-phosphate 4-deoxy-4-formamido-L-arabinose transferase